MIAVTPKMAKVIMWYRIANAMLLNKNPKIIIETPHRCEKSLRTNKSSLGQTRHRERWPSTRATLGICTRSWQWEQTM